MRTIIDRSDIIKGVTQFKSFVEDHGCAVNINPRICDNVRWLNV